MALTLSSSSLDSLSPRERAICERIAEGRLHKHIAAELGISIRTVHTHVWRASGKLPGDGLPTRKITKFFLLAQVSDSAAVMGQFEKLQSRRGTPRV